MTNLSSLVSPSGVLSTSSFLKDLGDVNSSAVPTDGQVLTWDNTNSQWDAADSGGGGGSLIASYSITSSVAAIDLSLDTTNYKSFLVTFAGLKGTTDGTDLAMAFSENGGTSFVNSKNWEGLAIRHVLGYVATSYGGSGGTFPLTQAAFNGYDASYSAGGLIRIFNDDQPATLVNWNTMYLGTTVANYEFNELDAAGGVKATTGAINLLRIQGGGNLTAGKFSVYGLTAQ